MITLSKRLKMVADMVTQGNVVADVGCDHAHTSIYLCQKGVAPHAYASDIRPGAVQHAEQNVAKYKLAYKIDVTLSDGLSSLTPDQADTILISGMGGPLMVDIMSSHMDVTLSAKELVLSPQSDPSCVRKFVLENGFDIVAEELCCDAGKFYVVLKCVKTTSGDLSTTYSDFELDYGKYIFNNPTAEVKEFIDNQINKYKRIEAQHPTEEVKRKIDDLTRVI